MTEISCQAAIYEDIATEDRFKLIETMLISSMTREFFGILIQGFDRQYCLACGEGETKIDKPHFHCWARGMLLNRKDAMRLLDPVAGQEVI